MLIRSQDRETIVNIKVASAINIFEDEKFLISEESSDFSCTIGEYSTKKKALKVLDMIQEAYAQYKITKSSLREIARLVKDAPDTPENNVLVSEIRKEIIENMVFQMPEDNEVEA